MDAENALKSEIFRPIVITIVPGLIALSPYIFVAAYLSPDLAKQLKSMETLSTLAILTLAIAAGFVIEDLGSRIETRFWAGVKGPDGENVWNAYLRSSPSQYQVGNLYIRDLVLRMKFENSFAVSLAFVLAGIIWLSCIGAIPPCKVGVPAALALIVTIAYLVWESKSSVCLLRDTRAKL